MFVQLSLCIYPVKKMKCGFCLSPWLKSNTMTQKQHHEKKKEEDKEDKIYLLQTSCSIHVEVVSKFLKIEDSKLLFKSEFSPINRTSTFFIKQNLWVRERAWRARESKKEFKSVLKNSFSFVISSLKNLAICIHHFESSICCQ